MQLVSWVCLLCFFSFELFVHLLEIVIMIYVDKLFPLYFHTTSCNIYTTVYICMAAILGKPRHPQRCYEHYRWHDQAIIDQELHYCWGLDQPCGALKMAQHTCNLMVHDRCLTRALTRKKNNTAATRTTAASPGHLNSCLFSLRERGGRRTYSSGSKSDRYDRSAYYRSLITIFSIWQIRPD